jgi:uncharacterized repeat protein (TIGR03803 family)
MFPDAGLVQAPDGSLYGITTEGGANNEGTVFRITPRGTLATPYTFGTYPNDGFDPLGGLAQGVDGNLYGTTNVGGTSGYGTVFKITPEGVVSECVSHLSC